MADSRCSRPRPAIKSFVREVSTARLPQIHGLQTSLGFAIAAGESKLGTGDPRSTITALEPGSQAARSGLKVGDVIVNVNDQPNQIIVEAFGNPTDVNSVVQQLMQAGGTPFGESEPVPENRLVQNVAFDTDEAYRKAIQDNPTLAQSGVSLISHDVLWEIARNPKRGLATLELDR